MSAEMDCTSKGKESPEVSGLHDCLKYHPDGCTSIAQEFSLQLQPITPIRFLDGDLKTNRRELGPGRREGLLKRPCAPLSGLWIKETMVPRTLEFPVISRWEKPWCQVEEEPVSQEEISLTWC